MMKRKFQINFFILLKYHGEYKQLNWNYLSALYNLDFSVAHVCTRVYGRV